METMTTIAITFIAQFVGFWTCAYFGNRGEVIRRELVNADILAIKLKISVFVFLFSNLIISLFLLKANSLIFFITGIFTVIISHTVAYLQLKKLYNKK
jgi:hypothetical protein